MALAAGGSTMQNVRLPAPGESPPWLAPAPSFAGMIIHGTVESYAFTINSPDPNIGNRVTGEFWVEFGEDGSTVRSREHFSLDGGEFMQESVYSDGMITTVYGERYDSISPRNCVRAASAVPSPDSPPPFVVTSGDLIRLGFDPSPVLTVSLPITTTPPGVHVLQKLDSSDGLVGWERREELGNGTFNLRRLAVDEAGRMVVASARMTGESGEVISETWQAFGPLEVIDPSSVSPETFALSGISEERCHD
jgi:hypothetical protein